MDSRFVITSKQLIFIIVGAQIATGIFSLPRVVTTDAGTHGWLAVILGVLPSIISILLIVNIGKKFPDKNFVELSHYLFSKPIGTILILIFILYIIALQSITVRIFAEITSLYLLPNTPMPVIVFLVLMPAIYIIIQGGKVLGRLNELLFYLLLIVLLVLLAPLLQADYTNILPLGGIDLKGLMKGALSSSFSYAGVEVLLVVFFMVNNKDIVLKAALTGQAIVLFIYFMVVVIGLLVFGKYALETILWPLLTLLKVTEIPLFERLELFFLAFWIGLGIRPVMNLGLAAAYSASMLFTGNFKHYKLIVLLIGVGMYVGALLPKSVLEAMKWSEYGGYAYLAISLGYPILYNLLGLFRKGSSREY